MKKTLLLILFIGIALNSYGIDSLRIEEKLKYLENQLEYKSKINDNQIDEIRRDQLNYKMEKDLIRETYKVNFDRINMAITFILGIIGVLGYLGLRDINSIKKQFSTELESLSNLRTSFQNKVIELDSTKEKYDKAIAEITQTNIDQNKKLQVIEIKEKINKCLRENEFTRALEYSIVALELTPHDTNLLRLKAIIYNRLGKFDEQKKTLLQVKELSPEDTTYLLDLIEAYIFNKDIETTRKLIKENEIEIKKKSDGKLYSLLNLLISYIEDDFNTVKQKVIDEINKYDLESKSSKINGWSVTEALYFVLHSKIDNKHDIMKNFLWFKQGELTGTEALERINKINAS